MKSRMTRFILLGTASGLLIAAVFLCWIELQKYRQMLQVYPDGMVVAGIPVGGLKRSQAEEILQDAYSPPIELHYGKSGIQVTPSELGFQIDIKSMLDSADEKRDQLPFWPGFWDFLWNRSRKSNREIPLKDKINLEAINRYLNQEIIPRYDSPPVPAVPTAGSLNFRAGIPGQTLEVDKSARLIEAALESREVRVLDLPITPVNPAPPSMDHLQLMIQQTIDRAGFVGLVELYLQAKPSDKTLHFAYQDHQNPQPDISFTAASTIKIPIMTSIFRRIDVTPPKDIDDMLTLMISESKNEPTDKLMQVVIDQVRGPLVVTEDMKTLGFENTFIAGYFFMGAPLLQKYDTPANSRSDVNLKPDIYNQTTPKEMGTLLSYIYQCADSNSGKLVETFPGQITQAKCQRMIDLLASDKLPYLITAGLPEGTRIAHKHGWIEETDGLLHTMSDAAIIYTKGGNYILTIYMYHPTQLVFDEGNALIADLSKVVYNFFNPSP